MNVDLKYNNTIVHFGVGNFHRAHQAYAIQKFNDNAGNNNEKWSICGAAILPSDKAFVDRFEKNNCLYNLSMKAADGTEEIIQVNVINEIIYGPDDPEKLIAKIAHPDTHVVSFTITEGGYNRNEANDGFIYDNPSIINDLNKSNKPQTVFGYLARAFELRKHIPEDKLVLLSCDNLQENGVVLKKSVEDFLRSYDKELLKYLYQSVEFPNSMVDRITPATSIEAIDDFENNTGFRDEVLVQSEDFFQWIIEKPESEKFPALEVVNGVKFVKDVKPYEKMKLGILNGGHSLTGLTGWAMEYSLINEAIRDKNIAGLFELYVKNEVIPGLENIDGIDYSEYFLTVKSRFENPLIKDNVLRIISDSTSKFPKFILPVIIKRIEEEKDFSIAAFIVACWWNYIYQMYILGKTDEIVDSGKKEWLSVFLEENPLSEFLSLNSIFGKLANSEKFKGKVIEYFEIIQESGMEAAITEVLKLYKKA